MVPASAEIIPHMPATAAQTSPILKVAPALFVLLWSTGFIVAKFGAPVGGPFSLLFLRFMVVVPILAVVAAMLGSGLPKRRVAMQAMTAGALIHGLYLGGIFYAVKHGLPAGIAGLVVGLQPILTVLFARLLLGEPITRPQVAGLGLGLVGVALVLAPGIDAFEISLPVAAVALAAVASIALGTVYSKKTGLGADLVSGTALQFVGAAIVLFPGAILEGFDYVPSLQLVLVVGWMVVVLSIGAVLLLLAMVRHGAVSRVAALFYLVPPTTAAMAYLLFGETLGPVQLVGTAAIVVAVFVAGRQRPVAA
jgi:drug/metabolite transporter (DMT)-like permease